MEEFVTSYKLASDFINNNDNWVLYWRNPILLFKSLGWEVIPYKKEDWKNLSIEAYSSYKYDNFHILYCEDNYSTRINYNFHHEGGHIISAHPILYPDVLCKSSKDTEKQFLEISATVVGRNVFLPAFIINHIIECYPHLDISIIKEYFRETYCLSKQYINIRFKFISKDLKNMSYPKIIHDEACKECMNFVRWFLKRSNGRKIKKINF